MTQSNKKLINKIKKLEKLVITDELTGLYNSRYLKEAIKREIHRAKRYNRLFSLMVIDVDKFKSYNDTKGHALGNKALKKIAKVLVEGTRKSTMHFRFGGDEFVLLLPEADKESAYVLARRLRELIKKETKFSLSIGVATYPLDGKIMKTLFNKADADMFANKENKKRN